ncbi:glutamate--tRNA ligase family protein [Streptosporangium subroseum]|uniref:glutamate--tRNA ligase family protein n=1 Tax=Streptosporangium subroseum TaxID=106412 RepID=UPI00341C250A
MGDVARLAGRNARRRIGELGQVTGEDANSRLIRGDLEADANLNDAVILKSSDQHPRLPTYYFAHAVDDHLMGVTIVIRDDKWISSVPP